MSKTASEIRSAFLEYFKNQGHTVVASSNLIPANDPTLLFTNAGMVPFKDTFLGAEKRAYTRAASSQKCIRAGGKHNDLENVGFTARHHTFFEMLGNFSFGDYFKKEAIHYAWDFLTNVLKLDKNKLYVTVFTTDDEAAKIWHEQEKVPTERIYRFGEKDNFWSMGDTGPCGPCSEIFVDRGPQYSCGKTTCAMGCDCDRYMEIWNLVFMQYERAADGTLTPLPKPSIDTGMGLERIASVLQNVDSNYETDLFQTIIQSLKNLAAISTPDATQKVALRVIADHARSTNFLIADGILPSNEGRGYVLRRIMRRAIRYGQKLGFKGPFFYQTAGMVIDAMGAQYPELRDKKQFLETTIKQEEERFLITLENGLKVLSDAIRDSSASNHVLSGDIAFKLYDTFGFPLDLTRVICEEHHVTVDEQGFERAMTMQKDRSRESWKGSGEGAVLEVYKALQQTGLKTEFLGYETLSSTGKILAIVQDGVSVKKSTTRTIELIVDRTPFYAESGGQMADKGTLRNAAAIARVETVQKPINDFFVIRCTIDQGSFAVGDTVEQQTEARTRALTAKNHTATHMLHHALRTLLGSHVKQAGSLVTDELLRFDFTHNQPLTADEVTKLEEFINNSILAGDAVSMQEMDKESALEKGAIAFFGDKYGDHVRVVSVGSYSVELCGGTHVKNASELQLFKILSETGIAAGVRRIIAVTSIHVLKRLNYLESVVDQLMQSTKASAASELHSKIEKLMASEKDTLKQLDATRSKLLSFETADWINSAETLPNGLRILFKDLGTQIANPAKALRDISDTLKSKHPNLVVVLGAVDQEKEQSVLLIAAAKEAVTKGIHAGQLVKATAALIGGSGGGKPDFAQAGGKTGDFSKAFAEIKKLLN